MTRWESVYVEFKKAPDNLNINGSYSMGSALVPTEWNHDRDKKEFSHQYGSGGIKLTIDAFQGSLRVNWLK